MLKKTLVVNVDGNKFIFCEQRKQSFGPNSADASDNIQWNLFQSCSEFFDSCLIVAPVKEMKWEIRVLLYTHGSVHLDSLHEELSL